METAPAAAYPPKLCEQIAKWAFSVFDSGRAEPHTRSGDTSGNGITFTLEPCEQIREQVMGGDAENLAASVLRTGQASEGQLLDLSDLLPDEDRVRESVLCIPSQRSFTIVACCHHGKVGLRRNMNTFPLCSELLAKLITSHFPGEPITALAFFKDISQPHHKESLLRVICLPPYAAL